MQRANTVKFDPLNLKFVQITLGMLPTTTLKTIDARSEYYKWANEQVLRRNIDTHFFGDAAYLTGSWVVFGGINGLEDSLLARIPFSQQARQFLISLNAYLFTQNVKTVRELFFDGSITTPRGSKRTISSFGSNLDAVLVQKEQTLAQSFLDSWKEKSQAIQGINNAMALAYVGANAKLAPPYIIEARNNIINGSNGKTFTFDYGNVQHKIIIGLALTKYIRSKYAAPPTLKLNGVLDTGVDVLQGETLHFQATGKVDWFKSPIDSRIITSDADGTDISYGHRNFFIYALPPLESANDGSLCAVIDKEGKQTPPFLIGKSNSLQMPETGRLILFVNDSTRNDNSGYFEVKIKK